MFPIPPSSGASDPFVSRAPWRTGLRTDLLTGAVCRQVVFLESICDMPQTIERNLLQKVRNSPDYKHLSEEEALRDLKLRVVEYEAQYESLSPEEGLSYIKMFNLSSQLHLNHIYGRAAKSLVPYVMSIHIGKRYHRRDTRPRGGGVWGSCVHMGMPCANGNTVCVRVRGGDGEKLGWGGGGRFISCAMLAVNARWL